MNTIEQAFAPALSAFNDGHYTEAHDWAKRALSRLFDESMANGGLSSWQGVVAEIRNSPLFGIAQQDPFTAHGFTKPRGYAGDALLLDWIYRDFRLLRQPHHGTPSAHMYREVIDSSPAVSVRWRRQRLADLIDEAAAAKPKARVLAVAAGHLREADLSTALQRGLIGEVVALDQDDTSLSEIAQRYTSAGMPVTTVHAPIRDVIAGRYKVSDFDLIYSAGLYDYLAPAVAEKLTTALWRGLNPGGTLMLTNFLEGTADRSWMEAMMDWWLIYRTPVDIEGFANGIPSEEIRRRHAYTCPTGNIGYLNLRKVASSKRLA